MPTPHSVSNLKVGDKAPHFSLPAYPSGTVSLSDFLGKKNVILAFYPKDDTPGCTKEMCAFSDDLSRFHEANTQVLGISEDDMPSHEQFARKYNLTQPLLADNTHEVGKAYGAVKEGKVTADRVLFVIDKQGVIRHIHEGMPSNEALLNIVKNLK